MIDKVMDIDEAVRDIVDGVTIHFGGFAGPDDIPCATIRAIPRHGSRNLTVVAAGAGRSEAMIAGQRERAGLLRGPDGAVVGVMLGRDDDYCEFGLLVEAGQVSRLVTSYAAEPYSSRPDFPIVEQLKRGEVVVEMNGLGTLIERVRAGRAGIPAFYSPVGADTVVGEGRETRDIGGKTCVLEHALHGDFAVINADRGDRFGNLSYRGTNRSLNTVMAGSARITIAEVSELVAGSLGPNECVTPGAYVDRIVVKPRRLPSDVRPFTTDDWG